MKRSFAIALCLASAALALAARGTGADGQPAQCMQFPALSQATQLKANAVQAAMKARADRKDICRLMTVFVAAKTRSSSS